MNGMTQPCNLQSARQKANDFLAIAPQFMLGDLPTESQHPKTTNLSTWALNDLSHAVKIMREVDCDALRLTLDRASDVLKLAHAMKATLENGKRIYFVGCGATGRLSLSLEVLWREHLGTRHAWSDSVRSLMAGGDVALVRSIENFEDHPEYGARMLEEAGFSEGDLLVASTEGGETPYVIGAALHAPALSHQTHWFLFCNPTELLMNKLQRSKEALSHPKLRAFNLSVGPMALSGSTRMQASTVLMLAAGTALFECLKTHPSYDSIEESIASLLEHYGSLDVTPLSKFVVAESDAYKQGDRLIYETAAYGITVMTDTTERSPTFSLSAFENRMDPQAPASLSYLCIPDAVSSEDAWLKLLKRAPRPLVGWENYNDVGGPQRLAGYNFSADLPAWRASKDPNVRQQTFRITRTVEGIEFKFGSLRSIFDNKNLSLLNEHLMLKMLLNTHSTLVMGRMGRYHGNVMTCVRPSNFKLIDRTIRYIQMLLKHEGIQCYTYEDICLKCFVELETAEVNEPIVLKVFERCKKKDELTGASASDSSVCSDKKIYSPSTGRDASSSAT